MAVPQLTIVPVSGLGNRMRVVASAAKLASQTEANIRLVWRPAWDFRARFDQLFMPLKIEGVTLEAGTWMDAPATRDNLWFPFLFRKLRYNEEFRCFNPKQHPPLPTLIKKSKTLYLDTCYALTEYEPADVRRCFVPTPKILQAIDQVTDTYEPYTLGVHIRRTDNRMAIQFSPLQAFCQRIDELIAEGKADKIFLSTDDNLVRNHLRKQYGNRLITRDAQLYRNSLEGIKDAVIDLWCLSRCHYLLGSYYSSFSDTAAELSDVPLEIINTGK